MFLGQIIADILLIKKLPTFVKPQDLSPFSQNDGTQFCPFTSDPPKFSQPISLTNDLALPIHEFKSPKGKDQLANHFNTALKSYCVPMY